MQNKNITILSLNAWHGQLQDDLITYITAKKATTAVFCFQEADGSISPALDTLLLPDYASYYTSKQSGEASYGLATYIRRDIAVTRTQSLLIDTPDTGVALVSTLQVTPKTQLTVVNVHGQPWPGHKLDTPGRLQQSQEIIDFTESIDGPCVVMGDFNLQPETQSVSVFADNGYRNLIEEFEIPTTRNEAAWSRFPDNKQLYADYAFARTDDSLELDFAVEDIIVSDHLPLILNISQNISTTPSMPLLDTTFINQRQEN